MKKVFRILGIIIGIICIFSVKNNIFAATYKEGIESFPDSYKPYLYALQKKHPNWKFTAMYLNIDFEYAVQKESYLSGRMSVSLSPKSWNKAWHYILSDGGTNQVEYGWVTSSADAVRYTLDPRNFLNEKTVFQFEEMTYNPKIHTLEGVEKILYGTEMSKSVTKVIDGKTVNTYEIKEIEYYTQVAADNVLKTTTSLNLRAEPKATGKFIKTMNYDTTVTLIEDNVATDDAGTWVKIKLSDGTEGYACKIAKDGTNYLVAGGTTTWQMVKYMYDSNGDGKEDATMTYAEAYMLAAKTTNVSPYVLALRTKNETSCSISSNGQISGKSSKYPGYYNYYSIGAYGSNPMENGVIYAKNKGWDNPVKAIVEGAKFLGNDYILAGQNTPYLEKYNVAGSSLFSHQYMTDITCIYREALGMWETYSNLGIIDYAFSFVIPIYTNMPEKALDIYSTYEGYFEEDADTIVTTSNTSIYSLIPTSGGVQKIEVVNVPAGTSLKKLSAGLVSSYDKVAYVADGSTIYGYLFYNTYSLTKVEDSTKMEIIASPNVTLRETPGTSGKRITTLNTGTIVTRIEKNSLTDSSGIWDKVKLDDGTVGYVCRVYKDGADVYMKELAYTKVKSVSLDKENLSLSVGNSYTLKASILPTNAKFQGVTYESSNTKVATVDSTGKVTGVSYGIAKIYVTSSDQKKTDVCYVEVLDKAKLNKDTYVVTIYEEFTPEVSVSANDLEYFMYLGNENIAEIQNGTVKANSVGKTSITTELKSEVSIYSEAAKSTKKASKVIDTASVIIIPRVSIYEEEANINIGDIYDPCVKLEGTNKLANLSSTDEKVAKVQNGEIIGVSDGIAKIQIKIDGLDYVIKEINVNVGNAKAGNNLNVKLSDKLKVSTNTSNIATLRGIEPATKLTNFISLITTNGSVNIKDSKNNTKVSDSLIATGDTLSIEYNGNKQEYSIVILGDANRRWKNNAIRLCKS